MAAFEALRFEKATDAPAEGSTATAPPLAPLPWEERRLPEDVAFLRGGTTSPNPEVPGAPPPLWLAEDNEGDVPSE